MNEVLI